jgi:uncharacterized membrane protein
MLGPPLAKLLSCHNIDPMSFQSNLHTGWLILGTVLLLLGSALLRDAWIAHGQNSFIQAAGPKAPWMSALQGYAAAALCFGFGLFCLIRGLAGPKR